jgi:hypothetical protein
MVDGILYEKRVCSPECLSKAQAVKELTMEDVWGTFDAEALTHPSKGMIVARGCGKVDEYFTQEYKDKAVADIPEVCPIWGDVLPYKSVTVVFDAELENQVIHWLTYVHGSDCVADRKELEGNRVALRSNYMCW